MTSLVPERKCWIGAAKFYEWHPSSIRCSLSCLAYHELAATPCNAAFGDLCWFSACPPMANRRQDTRTLQWNAAILLEQADMEDIT
jgi:hypothetical protein